MINRSAQIRELASGSGPAPLILVATCESGGTNGAWESGPFDGSLGKQSLRGKCKGRFILFGQVNRAATRGTQKGE